MNVFERLESFLRDTYTEKIIFYTLVYCLIQISLEEVLFFTYHFQFWIDAFFEGVGVTKNGIGPNITPLAGQLSLFSVLISAFIVWLTFSSSKAYKILYFILFSLGSLVQFGYWNALDRFFSVQDFYTSLSVPTGLMLDSIKLFFSPLALITITIYGLFLLFVRAPSPKKQGGLITICALIVFSGFFSYRLQEPNFATFPVPAFYRSLVQVALTQQDNSAAERETIDYVHPEKPTNNIVYIIDESIRADHLSLYGYERETTPTLDKLAQQGQLVFWPEAISAATCSVAANATLISGIQHLPDKERRIYKNPTLFHYAEAMGYSTHYLDASSPRLWNSLSGEDLIIMDEYVNSVDLLYPGLEEADGILAQMVKERLQAGTGHFIVLNKTGVHFPYEKTYPESAEVWTDQPPAEIAPKHVAMINHYDNGILWNSDLFFETLLGDLALELENTTIIYTSDHGQNLGEIESPEPHCGRSIYEVQVPLALIGDVPENIDTGFEAHHINIFPTILDLMGVPAEVRRVDYPISLLEATADDTVARFYMPGDSDFFTGEPLLYQD